MGRSYKLNLSGGHKNHKPHFHLFKHSTLLMEQKRMRKINNKSHKDEKLKKILFFSINATLKGL